jgi:hypothetical protein
MMAKKCVEQLFVHGPTTPLTLRKVKALLQPEFSVAGSNKRRTEETAYKVFLKYLKEVAGTTLLSAGYLLTQAGLDSLQ